MDATANGFGYTHTFSKYTVRGAGAERGAEAGA
jgi:hypothetical protein